MSELIVLGIGAIGGLALLTILSQRHGKRRPASPAGYQEYIGGP